MPFVGCGIHAGTLPLSTSHVIWLIKVTLPMGICVSCVYSYLAASHSFVKNFLKADLNISLLWSSKSVSDRPVPPTLLSSIVWCSHSGNSFSGKPAYFHISHQICLLAVTQSFLNTSGLTSQTYQVIKSPIPPMVSKLS